MRQRKKNTIAVRDIGAKGLFPLGAVVVGAVVVVVVALIKGLY